MSLVDPQYAELLDFAAAEKEPVKPRTGEQQRIMVTLYAILASLLGGKSLKLLQSVVGKNGFEAWRLLSAEFEPRVAQRRLMLLHDLTHPSLGTGTLQQFSERWATWEQEVNNYEALTGKTFDPDLKVAVLMANTPADLQQHLAVNASVFDDDYEKLKTVVKGYVMSQKRWTNLPKEGDTGGAAPMEVDFLKAKGKGKGKKKGKGGKGSDKEQEKGYGSGYGKKGVKGGGKGAKGIKGECWVCNKPGHYAKDCWWAPGAGKGQQNQQRGGGRGIHEVDVASSAGVSQGSGSSTAGA